MAKTHHGQHIIIHESDAMGFDHVSAMLLEFFDIPEHDGAVFILGDYIFHPIEYFRELYPDRKLIIYQLEQMVGSRTWHPVDKTIAHLAGADEIWEYDRLNVEFLWRHRVRIDRVVPMLYTPSLRRIQLQDEPTIDVLFTGFMNERRHRIFQKIQQQTYGRLSLMWLQGVTGSALDRYIADAKIVLNLHAFEPWHRQEQTRIFYPMINGRMVVSETSERNWFGDRIVEAEPDHIGEVLANWVKDERWRHFGARSAERYRKATEMWLQDAGLLYAVERIRNAPAHPFNADLAAIGDVPLEEVESTLLGLVRDLRVHEAGTELVRLGGPHDGGYVIPRVLLQCATSLISIGIMQDSRFEEDWFELTGKNVETYDGQWPCADICRRWPHEVGGAIRHHRKNAGNAEGMAPLAQIIDGRQGALLKIDAENAEYDLLPGCNISHLAGLVLEVHELDKPSRREQLRTILQQLHSDFFLVHLHGNNCDGAIPLPGKIQGDGSGLPICLELTFMNRSLGSVETLRTGSLPDPTIDRHNDRFSCTVPADFQLNWVNQL